MKRIHIVAGIILNPEQSAVFITKRPRQVHQGGLWEFPGGKVEASESAEQAMARELHEEIGIREPELSPYEHFDFDYSDKQLTFDFFLVHRFVGSPHGMEGQQGRWVTMDELPDYPFPEANVPILNRVVEQFSGKKYR